jgi:hypothetical protein
MESKTKQRFPALGMSPAVWGPIFWTTMHIVSLGYSATPTEEERSAAIAFYNSLSSTIPCPICKTHYRAFLAQSPVESAVSNRHDLIHWVFELHNNVNEQLGKPRITFDAYIAYMQALAASPRTTFPSVSTPSLTTLALVALAVAGVAGGAYYYANKK